MTTDSLWFTEKCRSLTWPCSVCPTAMSHRMKLGGHSLVLETRWLRIWKLNSRPVEIFDVRPKRERKTALYSVLTKDDGALGFVQWHGAWRRYAFFPDLNTFYEPTCLRDLANFLDTLMFERAKEREEPKTAPWCGDEP